MSHPDLLGLLRGELDNAAATAAGAHLDGCAECRAELARLAVGHALLSRAVRTVTQPTATAGTPAPPPAAPPAGPVPLPPRRPLPRSRRPLLVAAAAVLAGVGLGAAGTAAVVDGGGGPPPVPAAYATAALGPVNGRADGEVRMVATDPQHTEMTISTHDLPRPGAGHFYYAWLLDPTTNKMLPLGQVGAGGTASFDVSDSLVASYSAIDVSLEADDGDPAHSPTSVLRGTYGPQERTSRS